jgi:hypothetical protein
MAKQHQYCASHAFLIEKGGIFFDPAGLLMPTRHNARKSRAETN